MTGYILIFLFMVFSNPWEIWLPVQSFDRKLIHSIQITEIGDFGLKRKERPGVPAHFHTGIDIKRPGNNYKNEAIYPIAVGRVISKRTDGPYAQLIIEHEIEGDYIWTLYEHIADIKVNVNQRVSPLKPIARFFNKEELDRYGWQFDHFHFEVLRKSPVPLLPEKDNPERLFNSYTLTCYEPYHLKINFYDPVEFFKNGLQ